MTDYKIMCPECGERVNPRGIGSHKRGGLCRVTANVKKHAGMGFVPIWLSWRSILDAAGVPYEIGPGQYRRGSINRVTNVDNRIFVADWVAEIVTDTTLPTKTRAFVLREAWNDVTVRDAVCAVLAAGKLKEWLGAYGKVIGVTMRERKVKRECVAVTKEEIVAWVGARRG